MKEFKRADVIEEEDNERIEKEISAEKSLKIYCSYLEKQWIEYTENQEIVKSFGIFSKTVTYGIIFFDSIWNFIEKHNLLDDDQIYKIVGSVERNPDNKDTCLITNPVTNVLVEIKGKRYGFHPSMSD